MSVNKRYFQNRILSWYACHRRRLPWRAGKSRRERDPYRVSVSEVMLQQTQVDRVIPYYKRWMERWPTVRHLARARLASVIKAWAGLGYNRRAVYLHEAAITVVAEFGGEFPRSEEELVKLPGVGRYTARAILAFASGKDVGVLETNTKRVLLRIFFGTNSFRDLKILLNKEASAHSLRTQRMGEERVPHERSVRISPLSSYTTKHLRHKGSSDSGRYPEGFAWLILNSCVQRGERKAFGLKGNKSIQYFEKTLLVLADGVVPKGKGDEWNQALMDFGAMVCTAKRPKCEECPVKKMCSWYRNQMQNSKLKSQNYNAKVKTPEKRERFEETDRYFRGRIVDALRGSSFSAESLREYLEMRHGLSSRERFDRLITDLGSDGLIKVDSSRLVSLP